MDFIIDTTGTLGDKDSQKTDNATNKDIEISCTSHQNPTLQKLLDKYQNSLEKSQSKLVVNAKEKASDLENFYDNMGWNIKSSNKLTLSNEKYNINDILKKSVITPDFEKLHSVPPLEVSEKKLKEQRKKERERTKGKKWFGLPATEMTEEIKTDLEILKMRSVLDPKHFYKKNDLNALPKYFQIGKVMDSPLDFYNDRLTKKERKRTLVDELLADAEFTRYNKRKYKEIIQDRQKTHYKAYRQAKKLKRKNKN